MTWILGGGNSILGYGALIADTRVSWRSGEIVDALQKVHAVGRWMIAGFSGSVEFGFVTIDAMRRFYSTRELWNPHMAAWHFHSQARWAFGSARRNGLLLPDEKCSLILVGAMPAATNPGLPTAQCVRMHSPRFRPILSKGFAWHSIGSGSQHEIADEYSAFDMAEFVKYAKQEVGATGGAARTIAWSVARRLAATDIKSVSKDLLIARAHPGELILNGFDWQQTGGGWSSFSHNAPVPPNIASTWEDYRTLAGSLKLKAEAGAA